MHAQLRFETPMLEDYDAMQAMIARHGIGYVVFNDHLPHEDLDKGRRPKRLTGAALRIGRNPEAHLAVMQGLHVRMGEVPAALDDLAARLAATGVRMGSHDDRSAVQRAAWRARGVAIAEFPETAAAVEAAHAAGDPVVMGAPNVVRGGSHNGNVSAIERAVMGQVTALASDYHFPSLRRAVALLERAGIMDLRAAWDLVSLSPARMLGFEDRGVLSAGKRADLVVLDSETRALGATIAAGRVSYMTGKTAARFIS